MLAQSYRPGMHSGDPHRTIDGLLGVHLRNHYAAMRRIYQRAYAGAWKERLVAVVHVGIENVEGAPNISSIAQAMNYVHAINSNVGSNSISDFANLSALGYDGAC
jgi:hypothetical protein